MKNCQIHVKNLNFVAGMTRHFRLGQETLSTMLNEFAGIRKVSDEYLGRDETPRHTSHKISILYMYLTIFIAYKS